MYIFACEKRYLSDDAQAVMNKKIQSKEFTAVSALRIPDMGPGLLGKLTLGFCFDCLDMIPPNKRAFKIKYLDEGREEEFAEQSFKAMFNEAIDADEGFNAPTPTPEKDNKDHG
jgi:hypothetical protein